MRNSALTQEKVKSILLRIKKLRQKKGWSHEVMATSLGYSSASSYTRAENGLTQLDLPCLLSIAEILGTSVGYLVGERKKKKKKKTITTLNKISQ